VNAENVISLGQVASLHVVTGNAAAARCSSRAKLRKPKPKVEKGKPDHRKITTRGRAT